MAGMRNLQLRQNIRISELIDLANEAELNLTTQLSTVLDSLATTQVLRYKYAVYEALKEWTDVDNKLRRGK